ncbi:alpha/beta hydrolase [Streptomyces sp. MP131-18]|uniref:alpha/beta fold hydrolase n=1 Tax=Streptomyces sp. MP131-18 TaxID=1857892 RepID=UPI00097C2A5D|nr:alpha/beta hydrolase [Streptomyces sp. MP131-18]ONK14339.1 3-oxoadipate enol-lactonase 2 [Streptomyces sp. MP131-18]
MIVSTARGDIGVLDHGAGPPVLLLHPLALSAELWRPLAEATEGFRFLAVDAPGHGGTPWDGEPFTVEDMAADAVAVLDALGVERAGLAGLSMGGSTAVVLAGNHQDRIASLALIDTTACYGDDRVKTWEARAVRAVEVARDKQLPFQVDRWFSPGTAERAPETVRRISDIFVRTRSEAHAAACRALGAVDARDLLDAITAPTTVIVGSEDYATPPGMSAELHAGIAGSRLHVLDGARHLSVYDDPRSWATAVDHLRTTLAGTTLAAPEGGASA